MAVGGSGVNAMQMWIEGGGLHETKSSCAGSLAVEDVDAAVDRLMAGEKLYVLLYGMTVPNVRAAVNERLGTQPKVKRPSWDAYFLSLAQMAATRATCDRAHVGCVLVKDKHVLTTGYNGAAISLEDCDLVGHLLIDGHCRRTLHAEQNAIIQAALHGVSTCGATAYITHSPCLTCALMLINAGVVRVVYSGLYQDVNSMNFLNAAGIRLEYIEL